MAKAFSPTVKSKKMGTSGGVGLGAQLETMRYQNEAALPNQHDNNAKLFSDIGKTFSRPGDRPRGAWRNLGEGIAEGLAHNARSKSISERKDNFNKYDRVMNYLQDVNNAAIEQNQWYEKRESARREMLPQVMAYIDNVNKLDPQSQRIMAQDMLGQYGEAIGEDFKLSSIDGSNPFLMTIQSEKGQQLFDLRSMFAGDDAMNQAIAMKMPEVQMRLQEEREMKQQKMAMMEQNMNLQRDKLAETSRRNDQNAIKSDVKLSETLGKKIDSSREFLQIAPKMEDIVKNHPDIFQSAIDATWRENKEPGYINNLIKDAQNKWNPEKVAALTSMVKYINKMTLDVANGFARPNMFIEKIGSKAVPNLDMNPQGFLKVLGEMKEEQQTSLKNNLSRFELLQSDVDSGIADQYRESAKDVMKTSSGQSVTIKNPETGETASIDENQLDNAINGGWEFVG